MGIGAAHAESADCPDAPCTHPGLRLLIDVKRAILPVDVVAVVLTIQTRRNGPMAYRLDHGDQADHTRGREGVAEIGFAGGKRAITPLTVAASGF